MNFNSLENCHKPENAVAENRVTTLGQFIIKPFNSFIYNKIISCASSFFLGMQFGGPGRTLFGLLLSPEQHLFDLQEVRFAQGDTEIEIL